ncbi:MAG: S8 family peptidase [Oceanococcus sp.]
MRLRASLLGLSCLLVSQTVFANIPAFIAFHQPLPSGIAQELTLKGIEQGRVIPTINAVSVVAPREVLELYAADPRVKAVTLQRKLQLHMYASREQIQANDLDQAEFFNPGSGELDRPAVTGAGVTVAVIDSGVFSLHPDFGIPGESRIVAGANFELSLANRMLGVLSVEQWDQYAEATALLALQDEVGHGTHVSGTIAGDGFSASGLDNRGIAPGAQIVSLKIASAANGVVVDAGFEAGAVTAIDYLIRHREELGNVRVANNSWGLLEEEAEGLLGPTDFDPVAEIVRAAVDAGIVMVFSAGNDGPEADTVRPIPNAMEEVISVASACKNHDGCTPGGMSGFSSRGASVDITAPGDNILSTASPSVLYPLGQTGYFGDAPQDQLQNHVAYTHMSGTSMASPHIAGVVALVVQANPELTPAQIRDVLIRTADDMVVEGDAELVPGFDNASGWGLVNTRKAVALAANYFEADAPADDTDDSESDEEARSTNISRGGALSWTLMLILGLLAGRNKLKA